MRKSVPTAGVHRWWLAGWAFVMLDPDDRKNSIIEWLGKSAPADPVSEEESFEVVR